MLVMERLYPMDYRSFEFSRRELILDVFQDELQALHRHGFVHRDLHRPSNLPGERFDNIFLTMSGIRLINVGISALRSQVGDQLFGRFIAQEMEELEGFREYFLGR
jgi:serine/threonine protein kinase